MSWRYICIITGHGNGSTLYLSFVFLFSPQSDNFSLNNISNITNTLWKNREQIKSLLSEQRTGIAQKVRKNDFRLKASFHEKVDRIRCSQCKRTAKNILKQNIGIF